MSSELIAGAYLMQIAILDNSNYPMGTLVTPNSPVNGTVYSPYVVPSIVSYAPGGGQTQTFNSFAGEKRRGSALAPSNAVPVGTLTLSEADDTFDALVMGYTKDSTTATAAHAGGRNALRATQRRFLCGFTAKAIDSSSTQNYKTIFKLNVSFDRDDEGINQQTGENPNNHVYRMYLNLSTRTPFGQLLSTATVNPDGDMDDEWWIVDSAPEIFATYIDDGSGTSIVMPYALDYTEHAGAHNIIYKNGSDNKANVSGISSATLTVTAGTAAQKWVIVAPSSAPL